MTLQEILKGLGLNEKEITIYLTLLPLGSAPASVLGKRTNIMRSTAQYTCQQLVKKDLVKAVLQGNTIVYFPETPFKLLHLLEHQQKELNAKKDNLEEIIGDLEAMINPHAILPKVKFFEGRHGIEDAYDEIIESLEPGDEVLSFTKQIEEKLSPEKLKKKSHLYYLRHDPSRKFTTNRIKKKIPTRVIATLSFSSLLLKRDDSESFRETRIVYENNLNFLGGNIFIIKDRIYAMSLDKIGDFMYAVEHKSMAQLYKALFELAWAQAKVVDEEICKKSAIKKILRITR